MLGRILIGAFRVVPYIPGPVVRATVSCAAAVLSGIRPRPRAVRQLRLNLDRVEAAGYPHVRTYDAVRNYLRYFADVFVLSSLTAEQRNARVTIELPDEARTDMANGSIIIALGHQGDWDLAGEASALLAAIAYPLGSCWPLPLPVSSNACRFSRE